MKVTKEDIVEFARRKVALNEIEQKIIDRIDEVIRGIFSAFDKKLQTWYFDNAHEGEVGNLNDAMGFFSIKYVTEPYLSKNAVILLKDGSEWGLEYEFPICWLYENFSDELENGIEAYKIKKEAEKAKAKQAAATKKNTREQLLKTAMSKLTKEELKAIRSV